MDRSRVISTDEAYHNKKNRNFLLIVLILAGVIILLASIFLITIIYRTIKLGKQNKNDSNYSSTCVYGSMECDFGAICTKENQCQCIFNCTDDDDERIVDEIIITKKSYSNQCQLDQEKCKSFYEKKELTCSIINCSHGAKCVIDNYGIPRCNCPKNCDEYIRTISSSNESICGNDHHTYETICELNKKSCEKQENIQMAHLGKCQHCQNSICILNNEKCDPYIDCSLFEYQPLCASNFHSYSNECQMRKYACQSNINLTKLHDGICSLDEQEKLHEVCKTFVCLNGKSCMIENGKEVCRCLFNCSSEKKHVCASNGKMYRNLCELERDRCIRSENFRPVDNSYCCNTIHCPYGRCKQESNGNIQCECQQCSTTTSHQDLICGDNRVTYPSQCFLEYDACSKQIDIKPNHIGECNNCLNIICPFNGQCRSQQGNYTCICPSKQRCLTFKTNNSNPICGSNQELFYSQCEMDIRSCELKTHLYTIAPHYCTKEKDQFEYNQECGYDEPLIDLILNHNIECDTMERCPLNSYCNKQTKRCCVKVLTAILPYRMCLEDKHCGRNMICKNGFCQCSRYDLMPARNKRECISFLPNLFHYSTCHISPFGCCKDNRTISPTFNRHGCPEYCNCHSVGSLQNLCDPKSSSCYCRPGVNGLNCSYCENEYWAFTRIFTHNNTGCIPCGCHPYGSIRKDCLQDTGQCLCHSYTTGRQCDTCLDSSLILTDHGCINLNKTYARQRTCRDLRCLFDGICEIINGQSRCTCHHIVCTKDEQYIMNICASDGRTYKSKCEIKRQQCIKQYEILPVYPGVCHGIDEDFQIEDNNNNFDYGLQPIPIDSKRCITDIDCGENMVCLSEFCECAKQKYQRISGPRCIMPQSDISETYGTSIFNPVRHISTKNICLQENLCKNHGICQDQLDGSYQCLCTFGWKGEYCNEKINITIPYFNRQSYLKINSLDVIKYLDLLFTFERRHGLILYFENKSQEFYLFILIRNKIFELNIRSDQLNLIIPLSDIIDLHTFIRLQIMILYNEIQIKINNKNILSKLLSFEISLENNLYFGRISNQFNSSYFNESFQGCIHKLSINGKEIIFNNSPLISQNLDQCHHTNINQNQIQSVLIDRCLTNPCDKNQQCINIHPNTYLCNCLNCSLNHRYTVGFHSNSYIKHLPLQPMEHTGRFQMEIWFLSESSSGLLIYSEHMNSKKGHIKLFLQRKMLIFNMIIGRKSISLSSRYPIELNQWHQCSIEIYGQKLTLILNQESPVSSYELLSSNILWPRSFTFIGHLPNQYQSNSSSYIFEGFRGGIQKIILNYNQTFNDIRINAIELFNITEYYGYPCQPNPCQSNRQCQHIELNNYTCYERSKRNDISLELDGTINTIYLYKPMNLHQNYFDLLIKTKYSLGLIFYIGETSLSFFSSYLSLILVDGFLQFTVKIHMNSTAILLKSKIRIDDGRWHRIEIERFRRRIIMKVDDHHRYHTVLLNHETEFYPNPSYIYIGGYHRLCSYDEQHCRSYRGCLTNVTIDNNSINLVNDEINQHRILKQCHDFI